MLQVAGWVERVVDARVEWRLKLLCRVGSWRIWLRLGGLMGLVDLVDELVPAYGVWVAGLVGLVVCAVDDRKAEPVGLDGVLWVSGGRQLLRGAVVVGSHGRCLERPDASAGEEGCCRE